jgi:hypothetical protein
MNAMEKAQNELIKSIAFELTGITLTDLSTAEKNIARKLVSAGVLEEVKGCYRLK